MTAFCSAQNHEHERRDRKGHAVSLRQHRKIKELFTAPPLFFGVKCGKIGKTGGKTMGCCVIFCAAEFDALARPL